MPEPAPTPAPPDAVTQSFLDACARLEGFSPDFAAEWADGFITGVLAGPRAVPPEEWLPLLLPDGLFERTFADPDDAAWGRQALLEHARALARRLDPERLLDDPDTLHLAPLVVTWDAEARAEAVVHGLLGADEADDQLLTGRTWAEGVLAAFQALPQDWPAPDDAPDDEYLALLATVSGLVLPQAQLDELQDQVPEGDEPPTREQMIDEVCFALQDLRLYWVDHAPRPATRRVEVVPGRNDPCPCGSGRKYKKCHGA